MTPTPPVNALTEGTAALPFTAWEQAVFACIMFLLVVALLRWFSKESKANRDFQSKESAARDKAQSERDAEWRAFMAQQANMESERALAVKKSLDALAQITEVLANEMREYRTDFAVHDKKEWVALEQIKDSLPAARPTPTRPRTPRKPKA